MIASTSTFGVDALPLPNHQVQYVPLPGEDNIAQRFRLPTHSFSYQEEPLPEVADNLSISLITFPSPVVSDVPRNNTVHCEYYRPKCDGKCPAVIVLHIMGGDFPLARVFANSIAQRGTAALFLKMPYYGPRRDPLVSRRMVSKDPRETVEGMTQAILDIRRAVAFLASRSEIDAKQLGIFGVSLGGITGALAASNEPRLQNVCLLLAGGDIGKVFWESQELSDVRSRWLNSGGTPEEFLSIMKTIDPVNYAASARQRRILMLNATKDEVIPKTCTLSLWKEFGEPPIIWYDGGHYSVARHIFDALDRVADFYEPVAK